MVLNTNHFCCSTLLKKYNAFKAFSSTLAILARMVCSMEMGAWHKDKMAHMPSAQAPPQSHFYFQPFGCPLVQSFSFTKLDLYPRKHHPRDQPVQMTATNSLRCHPVQYKCLFPQQMPSEARPGTCRLGQDFWILCISSKWEFMKLSVLFASFLLSRDV